MKDSIAAIGTAISELLVEVKQRLNIMSESEVCESADVDYLSATLKSIASVLAFCDFQAPAASLETGRQKVLAWNDAFPDQSELLQVADAVLTIENMLLGLSSGTFGEQSLEDGMVEQAHQHLYDEIQANISLASRALSSYIESDYDREHIANIHNCLSSAVGGFQIIGVENAAKLIRQCARLIDDEYKNGRNSDSQRLEKMADCLVTIEYLLHEMANGRKLDGALSQLVNDNLAILEQDLSS